MDPCTRKERIYELHSVNFLASVAKSVRVDCVMVLPCSSPNIEVNRIPQGPCQRKKSYKSTTCVRMQVEVGLMTQNFTHFGLFAPVGGWMVEETHPKGLVRFVVFAS